MDSKHTAVAEEPEATNVERVEPNHAAAPGQSITTTIILFTALISISAAIASFDQFYGGTVLLMTPFNNAFGHCEEVPGPNGQLTRVCLLSALEQSLVAVTSLFIALGSALSITTGVYLGRRGTIQVGSALVLVAAAGMLGTSSSYLNYMVCKCIGGVGLGFLYNGAISYGVECTPPQKRGTLLGLWNIGLGAGSALAAGVCAASAHLKTNWSWKTPIACQIPLSVALMLGVTFFAESPHWLLLNNKEAKARRAIGIFMHEDAQSEAVNVKVSEIQNYIEFERATSSTTSPMEMFHRHHLRRTLLAVFILVIPCLGGTFFIVPYTAIFLGGLGVGSPFLITVIINLCLFAGAFLSGFSLDHLGRRLSLIVGLSIQAACMLIFSAVSSGEGIQSKKAQNVLVAFLCIWCFFFSGFTAAVVWVGSAEMHSIRLRTYGQALAIFVNAVFGFSAQFWTPYMISPKYGNMGTNVGYFYLGLLVILLIVTVIFVPETARLKLEQIDDYFASGVPAWKTSLARNKAIAECNILEANVAHKGEGDAME
ncbi:hypothetical protein RBB50_009704 [Rhinocladiella similis]